jgi:hypothetical protein
VNAFHNRQIAASVVALWILYAHAAIAATIVKAPSQSRSVVISVVGELVPGDEDKFVQVAGTLARAVVIFEGPGGNLFAGIEIGKIIRFKQFDTLVPNGSACASACALAWLAGATRLIGATGRIGFHAPYARRSGVISVSAVGNAAVIAYLNELGLSAAATRYITKAPPEQMKWLGFLEARSVGIEVRRAGRPPL